MYSGHADLLNSNVSHAQSYLWHSNQRSDAFNEQINWVGIHIRPTSKSDVDLTFGEITSFRPNLNTTLLFDISPHYFEQRPENNLVTMNKVKVTVILRHGARKERTQVL